MEATSFQCWADNYGITEAKKKGLGLNERNTIFPAFKYLERHFVYQCPSRSLVVSKCIKYIFLFHALFFGFGVFVV